METKMVLQNDPLWNRLQEFSLDECAADFPFSKKLAKEENWTETFTRKAIDEYKKFVYLCCKLPSGASPSEIIDKVWHMHLIYTQNYWEEFCPEVLQQKLHHQPSQGGESENEKHKSWFAETLENYEKIFEQEPPKDIWKPVQIPSKKRKISPFVKICLLLSSAFVIYSCTKKSSEGFSIFFSLIFFFIIIVVIIKAFSKSNGPNKDNKDNGSDGGFFYTCGSDSSHGDGGSGCGSSCGSSCGSGCGGCGGGGD
ncbi:MULTISPECIES: glycine-rich domain-containing protein [unclassified Chryseobacterium]|uniref:glycine-rich domain-containing protein n=1 Tax=unclassified Chryseobacterium TaxID=2593645 RepID=UPI003019BC95